MHKLNLIFLDTETTGTGPDSRLCQVAYKFRNQEFDALFKPPIPIEIDAMAVSHITNRMVAEKEPFVNSVMHRALVEIFAEGNVLVAHNAPFDAEMLRRENIEISKMIDTFKLAQYLDVDGDIPRYAMQYLRYYFDLNVSNAQAHNALGDIRVLEKLFDFYFEKMAEKEKDSQKILTEMQLISARPVLIKKFNFGKYNGQKISDVAINNRGYLEWLLNEKSKVRDSGGENDENWIYTLEHYLK